MAAELKLFEGDGEEFRAGESMPLEDLEDVFADVPYDDEEDEEFDNVFEPSGGLFLEAA